MGEWGKPPPTRSYRGETAPNAVLGEACSSVFRGYL